VLSLYTVRSQDGLSDVVKRCTWREVAEKDGVIAQFHKNTEFLPPESNNFSSYDSLSHSTIIGWIHELEDIQTIRLNLSAELEGMLQPDYILDTGLPWVEKEYDRSLLYVLVHNNEVVYGPAHWHSSNFNSELNKLNLEITLPPDNIAFKEVCPGSTPYIIDDNTKIFKATLTNERYNETDKFIKPNNIVWDLSSGVAVGTYTPVPQTLALAKEFVKNEITANKEKADIGGVEVEFHDGNIADMFSGPAARQILMFKYLTMTDDPLDDAHIKCRDATWLHLNKQDVLHALKAIHTQNENIARWEQDKYSEVDAAFNIDQLKAIETTYTKPVQE
jgi:hypothetical protein